MIGSTQNAKKPQRQRTKHTHTCNSETIQECRLINIEKRDGRKNNYIRRRRRNSVKISRSKTGGTRATTSSKKVLQGYKQAQKGF
jgi:hypothetical protein